MSENINNIVKLNYSADEIDILLNKTDNLSIQVDIPFDGLPACVCNGTTDDSDRLQAFINYIANKGGGELRLPQGKTIMIKKEIELKDNVNITGYGITSKIITNVGESENGLNMLKAFDKKNIRLSNFYIENTGYGKSGSWQPMGTFDGAGACILIAGCHNVVIDNCHVVKGGGTIQGEGVSNIYFSCCYNCKATNNHIEYGDNGLMVDTWWRYIDDAHAMYENDGVVFSNNTIQYMTGRGICVENKTNSDKTVTKGNVVITGNTMRLCEYAGIQGNNVWSTVVTGNTIHGDCTDIDGTTVIGYGKSTSATWYGVAFEDECFECVISDNIIKNTKMKGVYCKNARNVIISNNNIIDMKPGSVETDKAEGIYIKNDEYILENVNILGNNIYNVLTGINFALNGTIESKKCMVSDNNITFTSANSRYGITIDYLEYSSINSNSINISEKSSSFIGIKCYNGKINTINDNNLMNMGVGIDLKNDKSSVIGNNLIYNCTYGLGLNGCERTVVDSKFKKCDYAFNVTNGKTSQSAKCLSLNSHFDEVTNIKNGTGIILRYYASSKPTDGIFEVGDRIINSTPSSGSYAEWIYYSGKWNNGYSLN